MLSALRSFSGNLLQGMLISLDGLEVISSTGLALQLENLLGRRTVRAGLLRGNEAVTVCLTLPAESP